MAERKQKIVRGRPVEFKPFSESPVDIVIPYHGQDAKVLRLIKSILFFTRINPIQIWLVDDASPNKAFVTSWKHTPRVNTLQLSEQIGFGGALKVGFEYTTAPWVVFMHSDCEVREPNWLLEMGRSLLTLKSEGVRMVSPRTNNPGEDVDPALKGEKGEDLPDAILEKGSFLPLYCAMCHRELFGRINGFIQEYPYGWFEDQELAHRMQYFRFKQAVCGKSWIYHEGGKTVKEVWRGNPKVQKIMEENNRQRCIEDMRSLIK